MHVSQTFYKKIKFLSLFESVLIPHWSFISKSRWNCCLNVWRCTGSSVPKSWDFSTEIFLLKRFYWDFSTETFLLKMHWIYSFLLLLTFLFFLLIGIQKLRLGLKIFNNETQLELFNTAVALCLIVSGNISKTICDARFDNWSRDSWSCLALCHCLVASFG